jgi:hypothetical protein
MKEALYKIENWLREPAFDVGVKIYDKWGTNESLKGFLKLMGKTSVMEKKLLEAIKVLFEEIKAAPKQVEYVILYEPKKQVLERQIKIRPSDDPNAPQAVKDLVAERIKLWREAYAEFNRLDLLPTDAERLISARIINDNWRRITRIWVMTSQYDDEPEKGLPAEPVQAKITAKDMNSLHKSLCERRSTRSKIKSGRLRQFTIDEPDVDLLAQCEADIDELEHLYEMAEQEYDVILSE